MTEVQQAENVHRHSLVAHRRDPQYCDIVHNTVIGIHYVSRVRLANLQRDDPFRNQCLIWCEYFAENTLMMMSISGEFTFSYNRAARIEAEAKKKGASSRPTIVSGFMKDMYNRAREIVRRNEDNFPRVQANHNPPPRFGRGTLFRATKVFAGDFKNLSKEKRDIAKDFRNTLDGLLLAADGEPLPLSQRFEVYKTQLEAQARYCRAAVDYFYVKRLQARDNITQKVRLYKQESREVVNFRPLANNLVGLANYISHFEEATKAFRPKNIGDENYVLALYDFMKLGTSRDYDPVIAGLLKYEANPPEWTVEYQFAGRV